MPTWYVLRHADKERGNFFNPSLRHQDQPISQKGCGESERLCSFFSNRPVSAIYISQYQRTRQTIAPMAQQKQLIPIVDARLNEIDNGKWDGLDMQGIRETYPAEWGAMVARTADFRFPEGETGGEALERMVDFFAEKLAQHAAEDIVLVTHEGLIRALMCHLVRLPVYLRGNFHVDTCGIMEIFYQPDYGTWKLVRFNHTV